MATESKDVPAAPTVVLPAPTRETGTAVAQQPVPVKIVNQTSAPDPAWAIGAAIGAALLGAIVAQSFAAWIAHRFRRRDAATSSFDHAFKSGMAARRKVSRYVAAIGHPKADRWDDEPRQSFVDALTEFRAAVALYAAFDAESPVTEKLEAARDIFGSWPTADPDEEEIENAIYEQMVMESEGNFADDLRTHGNDLHQALTDAVDAFAERSKRPLWRR